MNWGWGIRFARSHKQRYCFIVAAIGCWSIRFALRYKRYKPLVADGAPAVLDSKVWAEEQVRIYKRNPVRFDRDHRGSCAKIRGTVDNIRANGQVILERNTKRKKPRVVCDFETRCKVALLDPKQQITVSGKLDSICEVNPGPDRCYELRLVNCRRE